jgi:hypothetical protein
MISSLSESQEANASHAIPKASPLGTLQPDTNNSSNVGFYQEWTLTDPEF